MTTMHIVTITRLNRAVARVQTELDRHGFWDEPLADIDVYLVPFGGDCYGWQAYGGGGDISIPALSLAKLADWWHGNYTSLADVLRHEYGHAVADTHRGLIRSRRFTNAFDASHEAAIEWTFDPEVHVTRYAAEDPSEDFAETFMAYLKDDGRLPAHLDTPAIRTKWRFIRTLGHAIQAGGRRW